MDKTESKQNVTERIKTFEDAQRETGRPDVPEFLDVPEDLREYFKAHYKMAVIAEALNEGHKANWEDNNEQKWFPWFRMSSSGFAFGATVCCCSTTAAGYGTRLCFKSDELATYAGKQFIEIWNDILRK
ncbi:MAG: hypothetical protein V1775_18270 [Bacteroidota bacterium]